MIAVRIDEGDDKAYKGYQPKQPNSFLINISFDISRSKKINQIPKKINPQQNEPGQKPSVQINPEQHYWWENIEIILMIILILI